MPTFFILSNRMTLRKPLQIYQWQLNFRTINPTSLRYEYWI